MSRQMAKPLSGGSCISSLPIALAALLGVFAFPSNGGATPPATLYADKEVELSSIRNEIVLPIDPAAFRRVGFRTPWQVTMTAMPPVPEGTPGASARATSKEPKPGLRLHWLSPADAQPILTWAPRNRYWQDLQHVNEAKEAWSKNLMPKIIVRRDGKDIASTFVAAWEPFPQIPWLTETKVLPGIPQADGVGMPIKGTDASTFVLYRRPESTATLKCEGLSSNGLFAILKEQDEWSSLDFL